MKKITSLLVFLTTISLNIYSQHCAPIDKTIPSEISVIRMENSLNFQFEFAKNGGQIKKAYQIYFIGYLDKNKEQVFEEQKKEELMHKQLVNIFNKSICVILRKDIITLAERYDKTDQASIYSYSTNISFDHFAKAMIEHGGFKEEDRFWGQFKIAVFIPFLDLKEYSTDVRLPEYTHECNYDGRSALLFQDFPYLFKLHSRIEYDKKMGNYYIAPRRIDEGGK